MNRYVFKDPLTQIELNLRAIGTPDAYVQSHLARLRQLREQRDEEAVAKQRPAPQRPKIWSCSAARGRE
jgi:hypothetical protein